MIRLLLLFGIISLYHIDLIGQATDDILKGIDAKAEKYNEIAHSIWEYAELGYQEHQSTELLQSTLREAGFIIETGVADIPTAFVASYGSGYPVIGILAEFDALPGVSQDATPTRQEIVPGGNGHACGHHLFGTASSAAAIAIKEYLKSSGQSGTIRLYGTPAEEGGAGKVYMVRAGLFDDVDAMLHWHPGSQNNAGARSSLANKSAKFKFYGVASHAAVAPQNGRSALDGVEAMNYMVNLLREHVQSDARIHYVITSGGEAPNVVPAFAEVYYYVRHPEMGIASETFDRVVLAAKGAAMGTGTTMDYEIMHGVYNLMPNESLAKVVHKNLKIIGGIDYTPEEMAFAESLQKTLPPNSVKPLETAQEVAPFQVSERGGGGSTDVGDISWVVPTAGLSTATWVPGTSPHTWQAVAAGGMSIGHKGMINAAKVLTLSAIDLMKNPDIIEAAKKELNRRTGEDFEYKPLLGDREPPLEYRKLN